MGIMGIFGVNWKTEYEEYVYFASDGTWKYVRGDGAYWSFWAYEPPTVWLPAAPANAAITLGFSQDTTTATINFGNGERRVFRTSDGKLTAITDRNGNTTALSYDNYGNLTDVTDPASRNLYFSYTTDAHGEPVVQSVTSDVGLTAAYTYNSDGSLSSVTEPDGRVFNFEYGGASFLGPPEYSSPTQITPPLITAVTDKNNKVLEEHTYDVYGRALTSSRYDGAREVESVTLSYPGWTPPTPAPLPPIVPPETVLP
jgi:YD repeat-containing protein